ncbi:hypothetical protein QN224_25930 [Sinorhizobium sp. 8-89]|uniref:hypothetical protein n=1 Tax=Sinorhizobium sp. 7-81 TaxID=3049087 RepID=UPI0024C3FE68|nr:hypothetical protein [Sinorhizobium sp. 7-81]MDK1388845.1 hypothetical protein [Sinorhizobium sp. 7-81]
MKWKLAFLYQNRQAPCVLPIFKAEYLRAYLGSGEKRASELQKQVLANRVQADAPRDTWSGLFDYADQVWNVAQQIVRTELSPADAKAFFDNHERFAPIKPPTQKIAGYQASDGGQLALELERQKTTIYLSAGDWLNNVPGLRDIEEYEADRSRSSNLQANAPQLALGEAIVKVVVPDMATLIALCDAYETADANIGISGSNTVEFQQQSNQPLNQILYGPPGTGKTFSAIDATLEILDPLFLADHRKDRHRSRCARRRIAGRGHCLWRQLLCGGRAASELGRS